MKIVVGISGASGAIYGIRLLEELKKRGVETHLILSDWGRRTIETETDYTAEQVIAMSDVFYEIHDMAAAVSSGSFPHDGMVVAPCSMKTLAAIASGYTDNLISRAADVCLKEQKKLILITRESPLSLIHMENMLRAARAGAMIVPPSPAFYNRPKTLDDIVNHTVSRVLDRLNIPNDLTTRWSGE